MPKWGPLAVRINGTRSQALCELVWAFCRPGMVNPLLHTPNVFFFLPFVRFVSFVVKITSRAATLYLWLTHALFETSKNTMG